MNVSEVAKKTAGARLATTAAVLLLMLTTSAPARAETWLVVPVSTDDDVSAVDSAVRTMSEQLIEQGASVLRGDEAAVRFERVGSASPPVVSEEDLEAWNASSRTALDHMARRDFETALEVLAPAQASSRAAVEELNRSEATASTVLDTCLYAVRALLGLSKRATARAQAEECARLSPGITPRASMHPPDVRAFYEDVVEAGRSSSGALLVVSEPSGCDAWVNGVAFGPTPARVEGLPSGRVGVQVECDSRRGQVHRATIDLNPTEVRIDTRFDEAVQTEDVLRLQYAATPSRKERTAHAQKLGTLLPVDFVLLVAAATDESIEMLRVDSSGQSSGFARVPTVDARVGSSDSALATAALLDGRCEDFRDDPPTSLDCVDGDPLPMASTRAAEASNRPPRGQFISGVTLASLGAASLLTGYALYGARSRSAAEKMIDSPSNANQERWLNLRFGMLYAGSAGAAALVAAMPLALPYRAKTPWWAWLSGGAGLALAATSIALAVTAPPQPDVSRPADPQGYVDRGRRTDAAFLAGVTSAPLLTMPLVYLLRRDDKRLNTELQPAITVHRQGGFLGVRGAF